LADEVTNINEVKTASDGSVKISVEMYNDFLKRANRPPVINRHVTEVIKTPEMAAQEYRIFGSSLMGLGGALFVTGAFIYRAGRI